MGLTTYLPAGAGCVRTRPSRPSPRKSWTGFSPWLEVRPQVLEGQKSLAPRVELFNFIKSLWSVTVGARSLSAFDFDIAFGN